MFSQTVDVHAADVQELIDAIQSRICMIETGTTSMRAVHAEKLNAEWQPQIKAGTRHRHGQQWRDNPVKKIQIKALTREQRETINRFEDIVVRLKENLEKK